MKYQREFSGLAHVKAQAILKSSLLHPEESPYAQGVVTPA